MLSRIAKGLCDLGRQVERAQHIARVLEVNHKMNLERASADEADVWTAISEAFHCDLDQPTEEALYGELVLSTSHPYSVLGCVERARDQGRAMRDHISEEMWLHLNRTHLSLSDLCFEDILRVGRFEFNARIEVFADAFYGMADDTMIRGHAWAFLRAGRFLERALMICRILEVKRKTLLLAPESKGAPLDVHQWQALLRSLSGYEPYRRAYDARILPERVLEFVLKRPDFPRSLKYSVMELRSSLEAVGESSGSHAQLSVDLDRMLEELRSIDTSEVTSSRSIEPQLRRLDGYCRSLETSLDLAYLTSMRPVSAPITAAPGAELVPQQ
jgi:uncharacterized alpha-E superfamily protein